MRVYTRNSMVNIEHVKVIIRKLRDLGSDVPKDLIENKTHALSNILHLATGNGAYKLPIEQINKIEGSDFTINWE